MKKMFLIGKLMFLATVLSGTLSFYGCSEETEPPRSIDDWVDEVVDEPAGTQTYYSNPVIQRDAPDPTVLKDPNSKNFYLYSTNSSAGSIPIYQSTDLVNWSLAGATFNADTYPESPYPEQGDAQLWAPEARYMKGKYVVFYSMAQMNNNDFSTIGYAVSNSPTGPFTHTNTICNSTTAGIGDCIDPFIFEENGKYYFSVGSFGWNRPNPGGVHIFELEVAEDLSEMTLKMETKTRLTDNWFEANAIYKRNGYYYLFASINGFQFDTETQYSAYTCVVGRSTSIWGPYITKSGGQMLDHAYETLIGTNATYTGPGHNSAIVTDDNGDTWIIYHGYVRSSGGTGRQIFLDRLNWDDEDWPYVEGNSPSSFAVAPYFNK